MGKRREFDRALPNEDVNYVNYDMDDNLVGQLTNYDMQSKVNAVDVASHTALIWAADKSNVEVPR